MLESGSANFNHLQKNKKQLAHQNYQVPLNKLYSWEHLDYQVHNLWGFKYHREYLTQQFKNDYKEYIWHSSDRNFTMMQYFICITFVLYLVFNFVNYFTESSQFPEKCISFGQSLQKIINNNTSQLLIILLMSSYQVYLKSKLTRRSIYQAQTALVLTAYLVLLFCSYEYVDIRKLADHLDQEKENTPNRANRIQVLDQYIKLIIPYLIISMVFDSLGIKLVTHTLTSLYDMQFIVEFSQMLNFMPMVM